MKKLKSLISLCRYINNHPLAGRHKLVAYSRLIGWQLGQLINPSQKIVPFAGKTFLSVNKGMTGATGNIYLGLHDFFEMGFLLHFLQKGDLFADVGANIGSYSILASGVAEATSIAFEPSAATYLQLQKNISINHLQNKVKAYNIAVGEKVGKLSFTTSLDTVNHIVPDYELQDKQDHVHVDVNTLDNICKQHGAPALVKIDVEGFETEVIDGMEETLSNETLKAIIVELNSSGLRYGHDENEVHKKLLSKGFSTYSYNPLIREFVVSTGYNNLNTLYVRDIGFVKNRIRNAKNIKIFNESF